MAERDRDHEIRALQEQVSALTVALNEARAKLGLPLVNPRRSSR